MARSDFRFHVTKRVRYAEIDAQRVVFNSRYLEYFDIGITEYWRAAVGGRPVIGQLDLGHIALSGRGEEDQRKAAGFIVETARFLQPDQLEEAGGSVGIRHADHRMKIFGHVAILGAKGPLFKRFEQE